MDVSPDRIQTSRAVFPSKVREYVFLERIYRQTKTPYLYGLYQGPNGERAFAKYCTSDCQGEYRAWFKNEIAVYRALWSVLTDHPEILIAHPRVQIPKFLYADEHGDTLILLIEYVGGDPLAVKSVDVQLSVYEDVMKFFGAITDAALPRQFKDVAQRRPRHLMGLFPVVALRALIRRPDAWRSTLRGIILFVRNIPSLIAHFHPVFVHRDITEWNIICRGDVFFVVDFQLSAIADPLVDTVALALRMSPDCIIEERFIASEIVSGYFTEQHSRGAFRALGAYLAVLNMSLPNGRPLDSVAAFLERMAADVRGAIRIGAVKNRYSCEVVHRIDDKLRMDWQALWERSKERHFFNSPRFFGACREAFGITSYAIVLGYRDGALCAVLPLVEGRAFGIKSYVAPGSAGNHVDKLPFLADEHSAKLTQAMFSAILRLGNVYLAEVDQSQAFSVQAQGFPCVVQHASDSPHRFFTKDSHVLQYMPSGQQRALRRHLREMGDEMHFQVKGIEALETVVAVEQKSYRHRRGMDILAHGQSKRFLEMVAKHIPGSVRIGILAFRKEPIATILGFVHEKTFYAYHTAFHEDHRRLGPGKTVYYLMLEQMKQMGLADADLLRGDSELKRQFAREVQTQYDVYLSRNPVVMIWWKTALVVWGALKHASSQLRKSDPIGHAIKVQSSS